MNLRPNTLIRLVVVLVSAQIILTSSMPGQQAAGQTEAKVETLIKQLTLDEKISLIAGTGFDTVPIPRLGIPSLKMTDGPVGVRQTPATSFPSSIALAASFDTELIFRVSKAIAQETKAKGKNVLLGPCVNIQRTPFGGRNFESYGEDPFLASRMAVAYINGIQSENVIPSVKHFAANNQETKRMSIDVKVDERTLNEIYFPAFRAAVREANVWSVMAAYNKLNGSFAAESDYLLNEVLKKRWGFKGLIISDWGAVHSTIPTIKNGLDLEMPTGFYLNSASIKKGIQSNEIKESQLDEMVRGLLTTMFAAGLMNEKVPDKGSIDTPEHRRVARDAAAAGIVLLQNKGNILPIDTNRIHSVAIIGPNADVARIGGGGSAQVIPYYSVSPLAGIKDLVGSKVQIRFSPGIVALGDTTPIPAENLRTPDGRSNGLRGEYYANMTFQGEPTFIRNDSQLDFHWGTGSPAENFPDDLFSNRWTGQLTATVSGNYAISLASNDGGRLYLDDKLIVDVWGDHATLKGAVAVELKAGEPHKIRVDHYESRGNADLVLGWRKLENDEKQKAVESASKADVAVVFVGLSDAFEAEARDRTDLALPWDQRDLIDAVVKANPNTVVVMTSGAPVLMDSWIGKTPAVIQAFYYGQEGGNAIADVLFGKVSPSGKLPATFPHRWEDSSAFGRYPGDGKSVSYDEGIFVGYRWFDSKDIDPLFPFGHGLSYTTFKYAGIKIGKAKNGNVTVSFAIENTGKYDAAEAAQVYVRDVEASVSRPPKELKGFQKIFLGAGEKRSVSIELEPDAFSFYDPLKQGWVAEKGDFEILVGSSSRDIRLRANFHLAKTTFVK
ncbi:MAG: glycoside hydrolase family 3 C-terminal domain-containing protein [Acidobacteriota bacterium]